MEKIESINISNLPSGKVGLNARVTLEGVEVGRIFAKTNTVGEAYQIIQDAESDPTSSPHYYSKSVEA